MINVLLCDDHALVLEGIGNILDSFEEINVIQKTSTGVAVLQYLDIHPQHPDIILFDVRMPNSISGFELATRIKLTFPKIKLIACTGLNDEEVMIELYAKGVEGFVSKSSLSSELKIAILTVASGERYFSGLYDVENLGLELARHKKTKTISNLTQHELTIAKLMTTNLTYKQIADKMKITPNSLDNIRVKICQKLDVQTRVEVAMYLTMMGVV